MDPYTLSVAQLKGILQQYQLSTTGRKAELIARIQQADPSREWMEEAARRQPAEDHEESGSQEEVTTHDERAAIPGSESLT